MKYHVLLRNGAFWVFSDGVIEAGPFEHLDNAIEWIESHCAYYDGEVVDEDGNCQKCGL